MDKISRRINIRGVIAKDGKILAVKHLSRKTNQEVDYWAIPGGGLEDGESLIDGLTREFIEETGIAPKIGKLLFAQQYHRETRECLELFFEIKNVDDYENIDLSKTSHGLAEISRIVFIDPKTEGLLPNFLQEVDIAEYINNDQPVYIADNLNK